MGDDVENGLLAIEVDADEPAESVSRTYQSEADFQRQKVAYGAKIDGGKAYNDLMAAVPVLDPEHHGGAPATNGHAKPKLTKKDVQLLGYAVAELYYHNQYPKVVSLCDRVNDLCESDDRTAASLMRWTERCQKHSTSTR